MKKITLGFFVFFSCIFFVHAQEIHWMSMNEALEAQAENPKKILMDVYTDWCGPCKMMEKKTFHHKDLVAYVNTHYYAVKFNAEGTETIEYKGKVFKNPNHVAGKSGRNSMHKFAQALKIRAYPTLVFFDEKANVISPIVGYRTAQDLEIYLKLFASDAYKKVKSGDQWKAYKADFDATFAK